MSGLAGGLLHPLAAPAHALALLSLGLLIGRQGTRGCIAALLAFGAGLAVGLAAIAFAIGQTPAAEFLIAATALSGGLSALPQPLPSFVCSLLAAITGFALGLDSPPAAVSIEIGTATLIGTGIGAVLALAAVAVCASNFTSAWQLIGMRILGSWLGASAVLVLTLRLGRGLMQ